MTELSAVVRFVQVVAAVLLNGSFAFNLLVARPAVEKAGIGIGGRDVLNLRFHRQIIVWCLSVLGVAALLGLCIQVINVSDSTAQTFFDRLDPVSLLTETQFGKVWLGRMVLLSLLPALLFHAEINRIRYDSFFVLTLGPCRDGRGRSLGDADFSRRASSVGKRHMVGRTHSSRGSTPSM
jgi:hypothetical protein